MPGVNLVASKFLSKSPGGLISHRATCRWAAHLVVSLLVVVGLVSALVTGVGVLFVGALLGVGVWRGRFPLWRRRPHEGSDDARLLEDEPEVSRPQDQVNETKRLEERRVKVVSEQKQWSIFS